MLSRLLLLALAVGANMAQAASSKAAGKLLFGSYCDLCHGVAGRGDGRMVKLLQTQPANLTLSKLSDAELAKIISGGGQAVGRSPQMPAWGGQLNKQQLQSLILYINSLRQRP